MVETVSRRFTTPSADSVERPPRRPCLADTTAHQIRDLVVLGSYKPSGSLPPQAQIGP